MKPWPAATRSHSSPKKARSLSDCSRSTDTRSLNSLEPRARFNGIQWHQGVHTREPHRAGKGPSLMLALVRSLPSVVLKLTSDVPRKTSCPKRPPTLPSNEFLLQNASVNRRPWSRRACRLTGSRIRTGSLACESVGWLRVGWLRVPPNTLLGLLGVVEGNQDGRLLGTGAIMPRISRMNAASLSLLSLAAPASCLTNSASLLNAPSSCATNSSSLPATAPVRAATKASSLSLAMS